MDYLSYASSLSQVQSSSDYASSLFQQTANTAYNNDLFSDETAYNEAQSNAITSMTNKLQETSLMESEAGTAIQRHIQNLATTAEISQKVAEGIGTAELAKTSAVKAYSKLKAKISPDETDADVELTDTPEITVRDGNKGVDESIDIENDGVKPSAPEEAPRPMEAPKPTEGGDIQMSEMKVGTQGTTTADSAEVSGEIAEESLSSQAMSMATTAYESASATASSVAESAGVAMTEAMGADVAGIAGEMGAVALDGAMTAGMAVAETAMASSVVLEPVALVGGAVMLGIGIADSIKAGKREKKEAKKKKKEVEASSEADKVSYEKSQADASAQFDKSKKEASDKLNATKKSLISNTHLSVIGGHTSLRL